MSLRTTQNFWQWTTILLTIIFVLVSVVGLFCVGKNMEMGMSRGDCPLMGASAAMCPMQILNHMSAWQRLFAAILSPNILLLLLTLVGVVSFYIFHVKRHDESPPSAWSRWRLYEYSHPQLRLYNFWLLLFARGLIQPKLFA